MVIQLKQYGSPNLQHSYLNNGPLNHASQLPSYLNVTIPSPGAVMKR